MTLELIFLSIVIIYVTIGIGIANVCLLLGLVYFYWGSYKELRSKFATGLLYFSLVLLAQNVLLVLGLAVFLILGIESSRPEFTEHYILLLISICQLIALSLLFKITWE